MVGVGSPTLNAYRFDDEPVEAGPELATEAQFPRVATRGDEAAVIWHRYNAAGVSWRRIDADLAPVGAAQELDSTGRFSDIAATSGGYAMAWVRNNGSLGVSHVNADGTSMCKKTDIDLEIAPNQTERVAIADTQYGTLVLFTNDAGRVVLFRFGSDCAVTAKYEVATSPSGASPAVAVGGGKVALAWVSPTTDEAYTRVVGERLCE